MSAVPGQVNDGERCGEEKPGQRILQVVVGKVDAGLAAARPFLSARRNCFEYHRGNQSKMIAPCHRFHVAREPDAMAQIR